MPRQPARITRAFGPTRERALPFVMWPAHIITLLRIPFALAIAWLYGQTWWVVGLIAAAATSDAIDGNFARWLQRRGKREPDIGGWLDPLADKIFVAIVLAAIAIHTHSI